MSYGKIATHNKTKYLSYLKQTQQLSAFSWPWTLFLSIEKDRSQDTIKFGMPKFSLGLQVGSAISV